MGRRVADPARLAVILLNVLVATWGPGEFERRGALIDEILELSRASDLTVIENTVRQMQGGLVLEMGDSATFRDIQVEGRARAEQLGRAAAGHLLWIQSMVAIMEGRFDEAERRLDENWAATRRLSEHEVMRTYMAQLNVLYRDQGRNADVVGFLRHAVAEDRNVHMAWRSALALALADCGDIDAARTEFEIVAAADFLDVRRDVTWGLGMAMRAEIAHEVGDEHRCKQLFELMEPYTGRCIVLYTREVYGGPFDHYLGSLASTLQRWDDAERLLTSSIAQSEQMQTWPYVARSKLRLGQMLLRRNAKGDAERAATVLAEAEALASELGMKGIASAAASSR